MRLIVFFAAVVLLACPETRSGCEPSGAHIDRPDAPEDVCISPSSQEIDAFDDYSWKTFLAMVWPAAANGRGEPDRQKPVQDAALARVFETFKSDWELFPRSGDPSKWRDFPPDSPCAGVAPTDGPFLTSLSELEDLDQAGVGPGDFTGPVTAQNGNYLHYTTGYNRILYEALVQSRLWLGSNLGTEAAPFRAPNGSVAVKAAWMILNDGQPTDRYYHRRAWVRVLNQSTCEPRTIALVALHVIQKTPSRPQWIWSTFEHVDAVPDNPNGQPPYVLNDGNLNEGMPMAPPMSPLPGHVDEHPTPFNVFRIVPINGLTRRTNALYQGRLPKWVQNYQLTMTQWPKQPNAQAASGDPSNTIPGTGTDNTAFSNVAIETFHQAKIALGCMGCHDVVRARAGFIWSVEMHARTDSVPSALAHQQVLERLRAVLRFNGR